MRYSHANVLEGLPTEAHAWRKYQVLPAMRLRACRAMSGTGMQRWPIVVSAYLLAMQYTDVGCAGTNAGTASVLT
eukprot:2529967-Rhodomonas_salina.1